MWGKKENDQDIRNIAINFHLGRILENSDTCETQISVLRKELVENNWKKVDRILRQTDASGVSLLDRLNLYQLTCLYKLLDNLNPPNSVPSRSHVCVIGLLTDKIVAKSKKEEKEIIDTQEAQREVIKNTTAKLLGDFGYSDKQIREQHWEQNNVTGDFDHSYEDPAKNYYDMVPEEVTDSAAKEAYVINLQMALDQEKASRPTSPDSITERFDNVPAKKDASSPPSSEPATPFSTSSTSSTSSTISSPRPGGR